MITHALDTNTCLSKLSIFNYRGRGAIIVELSESITGTYLKVAEIYFHDGKFEKGSRFSGRDNVDDFSTIYEAKEKVLELTKTDATQLDEFFFNSNLPETYLKAIDEFVSSNGVSA